MHRIGLDGFGKILADGAGIGFGRIGRAHQFAIAGNRIFTFQNLNHDRPRGHEGAKIIEERPRLVHGIEGFRLRLGKLEALLRNDAQPRFFEPGVDGAGLVAPGGVGLDD